MKHPWLAESAAWSGWWWLPDAPDNRQPGTLRYLPSAYIEPQLSQAVTAAEAMHRALELPPPMPEEEFKELRRAVLDAVPKDHRSWAAGLLARNEASLRVRLLDLAGRPDQEAMGALLPNPQRWAKVTVETRNLLTHTGGSETYGINEMYAVVQVTTAVVVLNLLHEVGLAPEQQRSILQTNLSLESACQLSRLHLA